MSAVKANLSDLAGCHVAAGLHGVEVVVFVVVAGLAGGVPLLDAGPNHRRHRLLYGPVHGVVFAVAWRILVSRFGKAFGWILTLHAAAGLAGLGAEGHEPPVDVADVLGLAHHLVVVLVLAGVADRHRPHRVVGPAEHGHHLLVREGLLALLNHLDHQYV
jgi:hypothetical protein